MKSGVTIMQIDGRDTWATCRSPARLITAERYSGHQASKLPNLFRSVIIIKILADTVVSERMSARSPCGKSSPQYWLEPLHCAQRGQ